MSVVKTFGIGHLGIGSSGKIDRGGGSSAPNGAPSNLVLTIVNLTTLGVNFDSSSTNQDGYRAYISIDGGSSYPASQTNIATTFNLTGLTTDVLYYIKIVAYKDSRESSASNIETIVIRTLLSNLVAGWRFDESSGDAADIFINNPLTNNNVATYGSGVLNNSVMTLLTSAQSLTRTSNFGLTYLSSMSYAGWVKVNFSPLITCIASMMFATNPGNHRSIMYQLDGATYKLYTSTGVNKYSLPGQLTGWHHIGLTWDQGANEAKIYLDGNLVTTNVCFTGDYHTKVSRFSLAQLDNASYCSANYDEWYLYNRILTDTEFALLATISETSQRLSYPFTPNRRFVLDNVAYCWFNSTKILHNNVAKKTWINLTHNHGTGYIQNVVTIDDETRVLTHTVVGTVVEYDDHNEGSLLVRSSDSRLFCCFTEHAKVGSLLKYRISTNPLDAAAWGAVTSIDPSNPNTYTYANCFEDASGNIYIFYRENTLGGDAWWVYVKSTDGGVNFGAATRMFHKPYIRITQNKNNKNILHFAGCNHPNYLSNPQVLSHWYFDMSTLTFHKSDGTNVTAYLPLEDIRLTPIFTLVGGEHQNWIEDIILDTNGYPRVLMTYFPTAISNFLPKYLYYSEWNGSVWSEPYEIHQSCNKNMGVLTGPTGADSYPPLACFDKSDPDTIYAAKEVNGITQIFELKRLANNSFTSVQKTFEFYDQWRPTSAEGSDKNLYWLNKISYNSYHDNFHEQLFFDKF